ncbi:MAG: helix-turn-helix transcriptional regulator [Candidatus Daviesbacteria bacterium]|nr:helix-turn-helix transcriptional regulator [Candidatus Daviesbacteria bacterium]
MLVFGIISLMRKGNIKFLGEKVKKYRKSRNLTQIQLAVAIGISSSYMSAIEQGARYPSLKVLQKISKVIKIDIKELL